MTLIFYIHGNKTNYIITISDDITSRGYVFSCWVQCSYKFQLLWQMFFQLAMVRCLENIPQGLHAFYHYFLGGRGNDATLLWGCRVNILSIIGFQNFCTRNSKMIFLRYQFFNRSKNEGRNWEFSRERCYKSSRKFLPNYD